MNQINNLISDLVDLNDRYNELNPRGFENLPQSREEMELENEKLIKSGTIIVNYYQEIFKPKYSKTEDSIFREADNLLHQLSYIASKCINDKTYFGLGVLLTPKGSKNSDPNLLEELITKARKELN